MHFPRLPDWLIYLAVVSALLFAAIGRQEHADAPAAPPPVPGGGGTLLPPATPFDPSVAVAKSQALGPRAGTAFSIADRGVWVTASHVVEGCGRLAIMVADGRGVAAALAARPRDEIAILTTRGGAPALPIVAPGELARGERAFHPGYPSGAPGEVASRLMGLETLALPGARPGAVAMLTWAEDGRTARISDDLAGLSGAPALDGEGRVIGVTVAQAPRRGRIITTTPGALRAALRAAGVKLAADAAGEPVTVDNYGRVADDLRRSLSVAQVVCVAG